MNKLEPKIIFEDRDILVIDKPAGLIVHKGAGEGGPILTNWFIKKYSQIQKLNWSDLDRPGIVHRLDKETSGLMILAKSPDILKKLQEQFQGREVTKTYLALALGTIEPAEGQIKTAISRHGKEFQKKTARILSFSWSKGKTRQAITDYRVKKYYNNFSLVEAKILTGRTHQIRVHFQYLGYPLIGDPIYNTKQSKKISDELNLHRQFLHAWKLEFGHPATGQKLKFSSELPEDLKIVLKKIT